MEGRLGNATAQCPSYPGITTREFWSNVSSAPPASILIVSDSPSEAALVKTLLDDDFTAVAVSLDADRTMRDLTRHQPDVLLFAFKSLPKATAYYREAYQLGSSIPLCPHRTVLLCTKEEVQNAY